MKRREERGIAAALAVLLMPVFLALAGLAIDGGMLLYQQAMLQGAVRSAALAATDAYDREVWQNERRVVLDEAQAHQLAELYLSRNMPAARLLQCQVDGNQVVVMAEATVPVYFMKAFGHEGTVLPARGSASRR